MKYAIITVVILMALTACTTPNAEIEEPKLMPVVETQLKDNSQVVHELRLIKDKKENSNYNSLNEEFLPNTLYVEKGDTVRISVLSGDASYISINNIGYGMKAGVLEFQPKNGEYFVVCEDCEEKAMAVIRVA